MDSRPSGSDRRVGVMSSEKLLVDPLRYEVERESRLLGSTVERPMVEFECELVEELIVRSKA